jgi:chromodomain-helicase-DNA-binding protein 4
VIERKMPRSDNGFSSASEDADELVADLLQQFSAVEDRGVGSVIRIAKPPTSRSSTRALSVTSSTSPVSAAALAGSAPKRPRSFVIEVPPLPKNADEYEFLPGHSTVRTVWEQKRVDGNVRYMVELQSSDKEWVSFI